MALMLGVGAMAQQATPEPSAALQCLTPPEGSRGGPEYPFAEYKSGKGGRVKVQLIFTTPHGRPEVKVLDRPDDGGGFVDAVEAHVRDFRVPCLNEMGGRAELTFEFIFKQDGQRIHWTRPQDAADQTRRKLAACVKHVSGEDKMVYPPSAARRNLQGRVLVQLTFDSPDGPPVAKLYSRTSAEMLRTEVARWVEGLRMPCHTGGPTTSSWTYIFVMEGDAYGFRPGLSLMAFLGSVRDIRQQRVEFDLSTMACPFEVELQYRQPYLPNLVGEVGQYNPSRQPFLSWLAAADLDLPGRALDSVYGDKLRLLVPCLNINLKPSSKE